MDFFYINYYNKLMRLRHIAGCESIVEKSEYVIQTTKNNDKFELIDLNKIFNTNFPIELELGMGKGQFITKLALKNNNVNYIGIEKYPTVLLKAIDNYKNTYLNIKKQNNEYINLKYMCIDVRNINQVFDKNSINTIYLNFSDPWPKKRHEHRRLTHKNFISIYDYLLKDDGKIEFKTDNIELFNFSLKEFEEFGYIISSYTYDLHNNSNLNDSNIMTEYEEKFSIKGNKICKLVAKRR